jgi:hypothetical protein
MVNSVSVAELDRGFHGIIRRPLLPRGSKARRLWERTFDIVGEYLEEGE